ncbi:uncharacterized protein EI97DRAFT_20267 [Westerdykella ornata]|uniref:Uncharacterized protein n=1 Tax=Westerdykella ornata TaxID=318751 RepID=A0A6A6JYD3_WESOR|nr:uncharacterized protein EI97DRAFT_20267 [Westerdykella ornata]KAF2281103.1 hypothetical protein EI97DRAFT_20267 [Westerdykella ornata]
MPHIAEEKRRHTVAAEDIGRAAVVPDDRATVICQYLPYHVQSKQCLEDISRSISTSTKNHSTGYLETNMLAVLRLLAVTGLEALRRLLLAVLLLSITRLPLGRIALLTVRLLLLVWGLILQWIRRLRLLARWRRWGSVVCRLLRRIRGGSVSALTRCLGIGWL